MDFMYPFLDGCAGSDEFYDFEPEAYSLADLLARVRELDTASDAPFNFATDEDMLVWALAQICESPLGRALASDARYEDWAIELDDCLDEYGDGQFIAEAQMRILILPRCAPSAPILARSPYMRALFVAELCRGLRGVWHQDSGVRPVNDLTIRDQIRWTRALNADYDLMTLSIAWDMREAGYPELWRHLIGSDLGDLAVGWVAMLERNPQGLTPTNFLKRMYLEWQADGAAVNHADHQMLTRLDTALHAPGAGKGFGTRTLTSADLMSLTTLPDGASYLESLARLILEDETQATIADPVNAAHLQQIEADIAQMQMTRASFRDRDLARKFFPDLEMMSVDTLV
jgi:hypothetical protein